MKLVIRSLVVLLVGCVVAAGCYLALGAVPWSALGGVADGHGGFHGPPPTGLAAGKMPANLAAGAQPPAGAPQFRGDRGPGGHGGFRGREGRGGESGALGVFKNLAQIAIVTLFVAIIGRALRSFDGRRMESAPDLA